MKRHIRFALDHPVFDPETQIIAGHFWSPEPGISAGLTCNLGLE
jgi:hypothetical protein